MTRYTYTAYGLQFESSFPLPELQPAQPGKPDVTVCYDEVPASLRDPSAIGIAWQSAPGRMLLSVAEVARYLILENRAVRIHRLPGSSEADVRIFLLGSVLGALLHSRHMLVLHASVIRSESGAVLFMGRSGAGKSTLLGAFLKRGYSMLADDKAGVLLDEDGIPQVMPGFPLIRLDSDAVKILQYPILESQLSSGLKKYVVPVESFCTAPLRIRAAYSIRVHNQSAIRLEPLSAVDQFHALNGHTYRRRFIQRTEQRQAHFRILSALSSHSRVTRVLRPEHPSMLDELVSQIECDMSR